MQQQCILFVENFTNGVGHFEIFSQYQIGYRVVYYFVWKFCNTIEKIIEKSVDSSKLSVLISHNSFSEF